MQKKYILQRTIQNNEKLFSTSRKMTAVPSDLLPITDRDITIAWATKTYAYRCVFNSRISYNSPMRQDLLDWINEAKDLCKDLRQYGTVKAEEEIIRLCKQYNSRLPENEKKDIKNVYDIVSFLSEDYMFVKRYDDFLDLLHMFQYGVFRCAFNAWALDAASDWMHNRSIQYKENSKISVEDGQKVFRRGKGFVYRLLVSRASNTLCVRFQNLTKRILGEYVIVRDRKIKRMENNSNIVRHTFNKHYYGYVIKLENKTKNDDEVTKENMSKVNRLIEQAIARGTSFETIINFLQERIDEKTKGKYYHVSTYDHDVTTFVSFEKLMNLFVIIC